MSFLKVLNKELCPDCQKLFEKLSKKYKLKLRWEKGTQGGDNKEQEDELYEIYGGD